MASQTSKMSGDGKEKSLEDLLEGAFPAEEGLIDEELEEKVLGTSTPKEDGHGTPPEPRDGRATETTRAGKRSRENDEDGPSRYRVRRELAQFEHRELLGVNVRDTVCGPGGRCKDAACAAGIDFKKVVPFAPTSVASLKFTQLGMLARALAVWESNGRVDHKVHCLLEGRYAENPLPEFGDFYDAVLATVLECPHRKDFLVETEGYPLFEGWKCGKADRSTLVEALEAVRGQILQVIGKATAKIVVVGGENARVTTEVMKHAEWVPIGRNSSKPWSFATWLDVDQPWEVGCQTEFILVLCEESVTAEVLAKLKQSLTTKPAVKMFVMMPLYRLGYEAEYERIRQNLPNWRESFESSSFTLCGFADGERGIPLTYAVQFPFARDHTLMGEFLLPPGARRLVAGINFAYGQQFELQKESTGKLEGSHGTPMGTRQIPATGSSTLSSYGRGPVGSTPSGWPRGRGQQMAVRGRAVTTNRYLHRH